MMYGKLCGRLKVTTGFLDRPGQHALNVVTDVPGLGGAGRLPDDEGDFAEVACECDDPAIMLIDVSWEAALRRLTGERHTHRFLAWKRPVAIGCPIHSAMVPGSSYFIAAIMP